MVLCDVGRAGITALIGVLFLFGRLTPWILLVSTFCNSTLEAFRIPAGISLRPLILQKSRYTAGMAADASVSRLAELAGFAAAGAVVMASPAAAIFLDGATFLLSAGIIGTIAVREQVEGSGMTAPAFFQKLGEGFSYLNRNRVVLYLALFGAAMNLCANPMDSFKTVYVAEYLRLGAGVLSAMSAVSTLSMGLGALLAPAVQGRLRGQKVFALSGVGLALVYLLLAALPQENLAFPVLLCALLAAMALNGALNGLIGVLYNAAFYSRIGDEYLGRVGGVFGALTYASIPASSFLFAGLSSVVSIPALFAVGAGLSLAVYLSVFLPKEFRQL